MPKSPKRSGSRKGRKSPKRSGSRKSGSRKRSGSRRRCGSRGMSKTSHTKSGKRRCLHKSGRKYNSLSEKQHGAVKCAHRRKSGICKKKSKKCVSRNCRSRVAKRSWKARKAAAASSSSESSHE